MNRFCQTFKMYTIDLEKLKNFFLIFNQKRLCSKFVVQSPSYVWLSSAPGTIACQAPLSMEFSRQEYLSRLPFPIPGHLPDPGIKPCICCISRQILYHLCQLGSPPGFPGGSDGKESTCKAGDPGSIPGFPKEKNGYSFQYSCLKISMDREAWWATVHGVTKSWTWLSN